MRILFNQSVRIDKEVFKAGQSYTLPDAILSNPLFAKFVKAGYAVEEDEKKVISHQTPQERARALADKLAMQQKAPTQAATAPTKPTGKGSK